MRFEIGLAGLGLLAVISLGFGLVAQLVGRSATRWLWLVAGMAWFVGGLFASEVVWGTSTVNEIQPIFDGLAFDESLLGGVLLGVPVAIGTWYATRRAHSPRPMSP